MLGFDELVAEVWLVELPGFLDKVDLGLLDAQERARTFAFASEASAARYAGLRLAAKKIVASYLSTHHSEVTIGRRACPRCGSAEHGPPLIVVPSGSDAAPALSLARSGSYGVVALASGLALGVDVEVVNPDFDYNEIAPMCCSADEIQFLASGQSRGAASFLRCWVRKEAVTKAIGVGVFDSLALLDVRPRQESPVIVRRPEGGQVWRVDDLALLEPLVGALARPVGLSSGVALHYGLRLH
jgi:4'-phosphopantetheinyl transferase